MGRGGGVDGGPQGEKLKFGYPAFYRAIAVPATIVPLMIGVGLAATGSGLAGVLFFVALAGLGPYLFLAILGRVTPTTRGSP